jgi:hypothetical protein
VEKAGYEIIRLQHALPVVSGKRGFSRKTFLKRSTRMVSEFVRFISFNKVVLGYSMLMIARNNAND